MAINRNSSVSEEVRDVFKLQQNVDGIISNVAGQIIPVCDVNPKHARLTNFIKYATGSSTGGTIVTTDAVKETYLTGFSFSLIKDATSTVTDTSIRATINGEVIRIFENISITLTAEKTNTSLTFMHPIKIDKSTAISVTNNGGGTGLGKYAITLYGFTIDNPKA